MFVVVDIVVSADVAAEPSEEFITLNWDKEVVYSQPVLPGVVVVVSF